MRGHRRRAIIAGSGLSVASGSGLWLVYVVTVRTAPGRQFGDASLRGASLTSRGLAAPVDAILSVVSIASLTAGIAGIALIALSRLERQWGLLAVSLVAAANATTWVLKNHVLSRPDLGFAEVTPSTLNSLPSGHVTAVFSVVVAVLFVVPTHWRRVAATAGGVWAGLTGLAVLSAGWHRAGDAVAAFLVVGTWAGFAAVIAGARLTGPLVPEIRDGGSRRRHRAWVLRAVAGILSLLLAVALVLLPALRETAAGEVSAFVLAGLLVVATAGYVLRTLLTVLEHFDIGTASDRRSPASL